VALGYWREFQMSDPKVGTIENQGPKEFVDIVPSVDANAEFFEIAHDFGDALELIREAISNSLDAEASIIDIDFHVEQIDGDDVLVIKIADNGNGMSWEVLERDFWGLGYSTSRGNAAKIGEKGHGTKIYLRSDKIVVKTQTAEAALESTCDYPGKSLYRHETHKPKIRSIDKFRENPGTEITIYGYNKSARAGTQFYQANIIDFIKWFSKFGSVEKEFGKDKFDKAIITVKGLDREGPEPIQFGHVFPPESPSIEKLFDTYSTDAAECTLNAT
jgi:histidine kinase/DNA gyrase B/HSP90-like ATPase